MRRPAARPNGATNPDAERAAWSVARALFKLEAALNGADLADPAAVAALLREAADHIERKSRARH